MKIYEYKNYEEYVSAQTEATKRKINKQNCVENEIVFVSSLIKKEIPNASFGLCHGTRRGLEQEIFIRELEIDVLGTDICESASQFPNTIVWDFNKAKDEWLNSVDFIYSNSFDHAFDPEKCLKAWMSCIKKETGICILHWDKQHNGRAKASDPYSATLDEYLDMINSCGFSVYDVVKYTGSSKVREKTVWDKVKSNPVFYILIKHGDNVI